MINHVITHTQFHTCCRIILSDVLICVKHTDSMTWVTRIAQMMTDMITVTHLMTQTMTYMTDTITIQHTMWYKHQQYRYDLWTASEVTFAIKICVNCLVKMSRTQDKIQKRIVNVMMLWYFTNFKSLDLVHKPVCIVGGV